MLFLFNLFVTPNCIDTMEMVCLVNCMYSVVIGVTSLGICLCACVHVCVRVYV